MSITINQQPNQKHIVLCRASETITSDELRVAFNTLRQHINAESRTVHVLLDIGQVHNLPGNFMSILSSYINTAPTNAGALILIGDNSYTNRLVMTFWQVYPMESQKLQIAASVADAFVLIDANV